MIETVLMGLLASLGMGTLLLVVMTVEDAWKRKKAKREDEEQIKAWHKVLVDVAARPQMTPLKLAVRATFSAIVGYVLSETRSDLGFTQGSAAELLKMPQANLSRMESGSGGITVGQLRRITTTLGCSAIDIWSLAEDLAALCESYGIEVLSELRSDSKKPLVTGAPLHAMITLIRAQDTTP